MPPGPPAIPPHDLLGPPMTIAIVNHSLTIRIEGFHVRTFDEAYWIPEDSAPLICPANPAANSQATQVGRISDGVAAFKFGHAKVFVLCYKFRRLGYYQLFPRIQALVVQYHEVSPRASAFGCATTITVEGLGFGALRDYSQLLPPVTCDFEGLGRSPSSIWSDNMLKCIMPPPVNDTYALRIQVGHLTNDTLPTIATIDVFNASDSAVFSVSPRASSYNTGPNVELTGRFEDYGDARCSFGTLLGPATVLNTTHATCQKPVSPSGARDLVGTFPVAFSPNGQCFSPNSRSFQIYNSQVDSVLPSGLPVSSGSVITILGSGFLVPALPEAACKWTLPEIGSILVPFVVESGNRATCSQPTSYRRRLQNAAASQFSLDILQNGADPTETTYGALSFRAYDASLVTISRIDPPGGPSGAIATQVAVVGENFMDFGEGQLVCSVEDSSAGKILVPATLVDSTRLLCTMPLQLSPLNVNIRVSLNKGMEGSLTTSLPFAYYEQPRISTITPEGANFSSQVTIIGTGFIGLSADATTRSAFLLCRFGALVVSAVSHDASLVVCPAFWGQRTTE